MPKFTWSDTVRISDEAPQTFRPDCVGVVCGVTEVGAKLAKELDLEMGEYCYTIEYSDGSDNMVPEKYLVRA